MGSNKLYIDDLYEQRVIAAAREMDGSALFNSSLDHAAIIVKHLIKSATADICIFSGRLNPRVYGPALTVDATAEFLGASGAKCKVLVESLDDIDLDDHTLIDRLRDSDDFELRKLPEQLARDATFHFAVIDETSFRLEGDKNKPEAIAAFGDKKSAVLLKSLFERMWQQSDKVDIRKRENCEQ